VCNHPERQAIDLALLNRTSPLPRLSREHHLSTSALHRHKQHLLQKTAAAQNRFRSLLREGSLVILSSLLERLLKITRSAEAEGNTAQVLQGARQSTDIIKLMHKLDLDLDPDSLYRLLESPKYLDQDSLLPTDLHFTAASRQALADHLFAPCPEPDAAEAAPVENLTAAAVLAELAGLSQSEPPEPPPAKWEKSGKLPVNR
jgi:hypothetical protein